MDLETLSNRILDDSFGDLSASDNSFDSDNFLEHYGVPGMKWGVRKDRKSSGKKKNAKTNKSTSILRGKNRRYPGESTAQYNARMKRESEERIAKINAKSKASSEKRALKSQEKIAKMQIKAAEKQRAEEEAKQNPKTKADTKKTAKTMSDQELRDAIARFRLEQDYKREQKKAEDATNTAMKKAAKAFAVGAAGVLIYAGKEVAKQQLKDIGNQNLDDYFVKKGWKKKSTIGSGSSNPNPNKK